MNPVTFMKKLLPQETKLFPEQEKMLTEFYKGNYKELVGILGRRSGKNLLLSLITAYECYRLLELDDPFKYYGIVQGRPIYILLSGITSDHAIILFTEVKLLLTQSQYFRNKIYKVGTDNILLTDKQGKPSICVLSTSANSSSLLGKLYFCLIFNEIACWNEKISKRSYYALSPSLATFKQDGHIITMSSPDSEDSFLHKLATTPSERRLVWHKPTWEMNPSLTKEMLRAEFNFMSEQDFDSEFGANFRKSDDNITVSIRLSNSQLETLKRLARTKAYENDTDISYVDIIRTAIQDYLQKTI